MKRKPRNIKGYKTSRHKKAAVDFVLQSILLGVPHVWSQRPVEADPMKRVETWAVYRATPRGVPSERFGLHLIGRDLRDWSGCISSKIVSFDAKVIRATTTSGRVYQLYGPPGHSQNGDHVLNHWARFNNVDVEDVTEEFMKHHGITSGR